jgi:hypothetical protein
MHPLVRDAYKRLMWAGRTYPGGLEAVRQRAKQEFRARKVETEAELRRAVADARWWEKELIGVAQIHKFRAMRKYDAPEVEDTVSPPPPHAERAQPRP